jgi:hypothetical protein
MLQNRKLKMKKNIPAAPASYGKYALFAGLSVALALVSSLATAASFTPGSIVAYRVGTGTTANSSTASNAVFLDEYSPSGTLLQSVAMPTAAGSAPLTNPLTASTGATEGLLMRSVNGQCLTVTGYAAAAGTASIVATASTSVQREVAFISATAGVNTTTTLGTVAGSASNIRGAVSNDCAEAWASSNGTASANKGTWYAASVGATTSTQIESSPATTQGIDITTLSGGSKQLYASDGGFSKIGSGLPTSASAATALSPFPTADNYRGVAFVQLNSSSTGSDTVYVADSSANTIAKYSWNGTAWSAVGSIATTTVLLPPSGAARSSFGTTGLTAVNLGDGEVALYFTDSTTGNIYQVIDTSGYGGTLPSQPPLFTLFATATGSGADAIYLGLALSPESVLPGSAPGSVTGVNASSITATGFTANWTAPSSGGAVAYYVVDVSTGSSFSTVSQTILVPAGTTSATITGLSSGATNYFRVRAVNSYENSYGANAGASADSSVTTVVPQSITFGTAPTGITPGGSGAVTATGGGSGNAVTFTSQTTDVCTVTSDGTVVTGVAVGTCTIAANQTGGSSGNTYYGAATQVTQSFAIGTIAQTISFGTAPTVVVGGTGTVSATATSGLTVTLTSATTGICTISGNTVTGVAAGTCTINANQAGNASYTAATQVQQNITIGMASQTITFGALPTSIPVNGTATASATGGASGNAVTFTSQTPGVCTVSGSTVTGVAAGTCTIAANQAGNSNYSAATQVTQSSTIVAPFTAGSIVGYRVGSGSGTAVGAQANAVFLDEYSPSGTLIQSVPMPAVAGSGSLLNPLTASSTGSEGLLNRSVDGTCLTVPGYDAPVGTLAIAAAAASGVGAVERDVAFVAASGVVDTTTTLGPNAFGGSNVRGAVTDTCGHAWVTGNGSGAANYGVWYATDGATSATQIYNVNTQGVDIATLNGASAAQLYASVGTLDAIGTGVPTTGIQPVSVLSSNMGAYNYRGMTFLQMQAGSTGADTLYLADNSNAPETIDKYVLVGGVWTAAGSFATASQPVLPTGTSSSSFNTTGLTAVNLGDGEVALYFTDSKNGYIYRVIDNSGATGTLTQPAAFSLFATATGSPTYAVYYGVAPSPESVLPTSVPNAATNASASAITSTSFTANWAAPGGALSYYVVDVSTSNSFATVQQTILVPAGTTTASISGLSAGAAADYTNYFRVRAVNSFGASTDLVSGPIAPPNTPQTITFGTAPSIAASYTGTVSATGGASGSPIVFTSQTPGTCSVSGSTVTGITAGTCTIAADQAASGNYLAASEVTQSFAITAAPVSQTISFGTAPTIVYGGTGTVSATASSGLAVTLTSATTGVCTLSGSTLTAVAAGTCTINANQAGNGSYYAATQVAQTFSIGTAPQVIAFGSLPVVSGGTATGVVTVGSTATVAAAGGASGNAVTFSSATPGVCTVSGSTVTGVAAGTCIVAADQAGTANYSAATEVTQSFTIANAISAFTPDNIVISTVFNINNGGADLDTASPLVLQEFHLGAGNTSATLTGALTLPQTGSGSNSAISGEFGSASEGMLEQSANGVYLTIMGYGVNAATFNTAPTSTYSTAALGQSISLTAASQSGNAVIYTTVPRVVALIGTNTSVDTTTALTDIYNSNNPRSVVTVDGTSFYTSGQGPTNSSTDTMQGVAYATLGASSATIIDDSSDTRSLHIFNSGSGNTLYVSRDNKKVPAANVSTLTSASGGLPTSASGLVTTQVTPPTGNTITVSSGTSNGVNSAGSTVYLSPEGFFMASPTVMYVADGGAPKDGGVGAGGLQKWVLSDGVWTLDYVLVNGLNLVNNANANAATPTAPGVTGLIGLTGKVIDGQVYLYATSYGLNELSQSYLYEITDTLSYTTISQAGSEQFSVLYTDASGQTSIRGVAFAPAILQAITFGSAPTVVAGGTGTLSATGGASGNAVIFTSATPGTCTVSGNTVTGVAVGTCTIDADQAGNSSYSTATTATQSFTIAVGPQAITFGAAPTVTVGGTGALSATGGASGNAVTFTSQTTGVCTVSGSTVTGVAQGICTIAADQAGNASFGAATEVTQNITIGKLSQSISGASAALGSGSLSFFPAATVSGTKGTTITLNATDTAGLTVSYSSTTPSVCTVSGGTVTILAKGTCTIAANQAGNADYNAAPTVTQSIGQTIVCDTNTPLATVNTCAPDARLYIAGSSALAGAVQTVVQNDLFDTTTTPVITILDNGSANAVSAWYGMSKAALTGGTSKRLFVVYNNNNGSGSGVSQLLATESPTKTALVPEADVVIIGPASTTAAGSCALNGSSTAQAPVIACTTHAPTQADMAISDVNVTELYALETTTAGKALDATPTKPLTTLTVAPLAVQGFGIAVNSNLYAALQAQNVADGLLPGSCMPAAGGYGGSNADSAASGVPANAQAACQPTVRKADYSSLISGKFAGTPTGTLLSGNGDATALTLARFSDYSGTQAASNIFFANNACDNPVVGGKTTEGLLGGALDIISSTTTGLPSSLTVQANKTTAAVVTALDSSSNYVIGVLGLGTVQGADDTWKFVRIDGISPNFTLAGTYDSTQRAAFSSGLYDFAETAFAVTPTKPVANSIGDTKSGDGGFPLVITAVIDGLKSSALHDLTGIGYTDSGADGAVSGQQTAYQHAGTPPNNCAPVKHL